MTAAPSKTVFAMLLLDVFLADHAESAWFAEYKRLLDAEEGELKQLGFDVTDRFIDTGEVASL